MNQLLKIIYYMNILKIRFNIKTSESIYLIRRKIQNRKSAAKKRYSIKEII